MQDLQAILRQASSDYERDGVAVIPDVFSWQECQKMRAAGLMALAKISAIRQAGYPHNILETVTFEGQAFPALLFFPALVEPYLEQVRTDDRLVRIVRHFLGDDVKQLNNQFYYRMPGDGDKFAWHQDTYFRKPAEDYPSIDENNAYLQTIVAIDDITEDNGPVECILGSHKWGNIAILEKREAELSAQPPVAGKRVARVPPLRDFQRGDWRGTKIQMKAGSVVVWSGLVVHCSEPNQSDRTRFTYMNGFARADAAAKWFYYLKGGVPQPIVPALIP